MPYVKQHFGLCNDMVANLITVVGLGLGMSGIGYRNSVIVLFPQILARREPGHLLEETGEMMGKIEAEKARGLADVVAVHEQALGLVDDIVMDVADGRSSSRLVDNISEITRRIGQL